MRNMKRWACSSAAAIPNWAATRARSVCSDSTIIRATGGSWTARAYCPAIPPTHRSPRDLLAEVNARYAKPIFIAETGCEGTFRPAWLRFVADEVAAARAAQVPVEGICLYPVLDHPGWDDGRHCPNGLFDGCGDRAVYAPLADEVAAQRARFGGSTG